MINDMEQDKAKKIFLVAVPLILAVFGYFVYTSVNSDEKKVEEKAEAIPIPHGEDESEKISKFEALKRARQKREQENRKREKSNNANIWGERPVEKEEELVEKDTVKEEVEQPKVKERIVYRNVNPEPTTVKEPIKEEPKKLTRDGFYGVSSSMESQSSVGNDDDNSNIESDNFLKCVTYRDQEVAPGGIIALRVVEKGVVNGVEVPRNTLIDANVSQGGDRLRISVDNIKIGNNIVPVSLKGYSYNGEEGLYSPESVNQDIVQDQVGSAARNLNTRVSVPVLGSVSIGGGNAANKKTRDRSVPVADNTSVILK